MNTNRAVRVQSCAFPHHWEEILQSKIHLAWKQMNIYLFLNYEIYIFPYKSTQCWFIKWHPSGWWLFLHVPLLRLFKMYSRQFISFINNVKTKEKSEHKPRQINGWSILLDQRQMMVSATTGPSSGDLAVTVSSVLSNPPSGTITTFSRCCPLVK